jgi:hypothetical protein
MPDSEIEIPEWKKKIMSSQYVSSFGNYSNKTLTNNFADIDQRLKDLEHKVNPTAKKIVSKRSQQMLILHHLGVLDKLDEFKISNKKKAKFLSILLNASPDNIEEDLSIILNPKSRLNTVANYKIVVDAYKQAGIKTIANDTEIILEKLSKK